MKQLYILMLGSKFMNISKIFVKVIAYNKTIYFDYYISRVHFNRTDVHTRSTYIKIHI